MDELTQNVARQIIDRVGGPGQPPEYGFQFFTAGIGQYLSVIDEEYLHTLIRQGGSSFKMVVGVYGGGKTHFLLSIRDLAWKHKYVTANVDLSPKESPFSKLELVYKNIIRNIIPPLKPEELLKTYERGIEAFILRWCADKYREYQLRGISESVWNDELIIDVDQIRGIESTSFLAAFKGTIRAIANKRDDDFSLIVQWLKGEGHTAEHKKYNILQKIDKTNAFEMIRSLSQLLRQLGYSGLVISFDEAEQQSSMSTRERSSLMSNLRQVIDECAKSTFQGVMIFYAVPDDNFLEGRTQDYEALRQRVQPVFDEINPTGVKIELDRVIPEPEVFLEEVGNKLTTVYQTAYGFRFENQQDLQSTLHQVINIAISSRFGDVGYKRVFVQKYIKGLNYLYRRNAVPSENDLE